MTQTIQNGISSLENLFSVNTFRIPQYQRAYSWENSPQLEAFLEDLRQQVKTQSKLPDKQYFLGTLLLHEQDVGAGRKVVNIVDGQQRMTTSVIFIATALALHQSETIALSSKVRALLRRNFVIDDEAEGQKFRTIKEDEPFFQSQVLRISSACVEVDSPSSCRMRSAVDFFSSKVLPEEWESLLAALRTARVMVYAVSSAEDATQIFELQNDRGKPLTSLEALKSFLMHCIYLHSSVQADSLLDALHEQFSKIFRTVESLAEMDRTPDEDQLLSNHCAAFLAWTVKEYNNPKQLVKSIIKSLDDGKVIGWIQSFVSSLSESYHSILEMFKTRDALPEFSELLLLGRMGSYWPLLIKVWRQDTSKDKPEFRKTCRLLEVFTFRGHAVVGLRSDTGHSVFQILARDFNGDYALLYKKLCDQSHSYELDSRFKLGLDIKNFYNNSADAIYLLWRYENHLRDQTGQRQPLLSWRDFVEPRRYAAKFSLEHIAAQDGPLALTEVEWESGVSEPFADVALHRLGNLVIDSISPNSSKGKKDFAGKIKSLSQNSIYLSQGELIKFVEKEEPGTEDWNVDAIRKRHARLIEFSCETWDPDKWHKPDVTD